MHAVTNDRSYVIFVTFHKKNMTTSAIYTFLVYAQCNMIMLNPPITRITHPREQEEKKIITKAKQLFE